MYKYQIAVYELYKKFGDKIFCTYEAEDVFKQAKQFEIYRPALALARRRGLLEKVAPQEAKKFRSNWHHAMNFKRLSSKGIEFAQHIEAHPELITKHLLRSHNKNA